VEYVEALILHLSRSREGDRGGRRIARGVGLGTGSLFALEVGLAVPLHLSCLRE